MSTRLSAEVVESLLAAASALWKVSNAWEDNDQASWDAYVAAGNPSPFHLSIDEVAAQIADFVDAFRTVEDVLAAAAAPGRPHELTGLDAALAAFAAAPFACGCGNVADEDGFAFCLPDGTPVEPSADSAWDGDYRCNACGAVVKIPAEVAR